jgi:tripartite-type tricarboxylate transporter receptor subunit TctC
MSTGSGWRRLLGGALCSLACAGYAHTAAAAQADPWPTRPLRLIVPYAAGGSTDIVGRAFAQKMTEVLGKSMVVDNRGGAAGSVATSAYAKGALDDHAFLMVTVGQLSINQFLYKSLGYDPEADLQPIGLVGHTPNVLVVHPSSPTRSMTELIEYAKANPGKLSYSSAGIGSTGHLLNELIKTRVGIQIVHVPYKGNGPAMQALLAGEVQFNTDNMPQLLPRVRGGQLRALAVSSRQRWTQLPDIATFAELGYPELTTMVWFGVVAHSRMPKAIVTRMNREMNAVLTQPDVTARFLELSMENITSTPEGMLALAREERERWRKVVLASGATAD